jgi:GT2 family glycosyltransferase/glycosyltransferase involved in cell wall biosynthesis
MKILIVTPESPHKAGGGIATYAKHAAAAHRATGHDVYFFTWKHGSSAAKAGLREVDDGRTRILDINDAAVWKAFPAGPFNVSLSHFLFPYIKRFVADIRPDVIESTDYLSPLYVYLMARRSGRLGEFSNIPVTHYNHGLVREIYRANASIPAIAVQAELAAERMVLKWSDKVFAPSQTALQVMHRQLGAVGNEIVSPEPYKFDCEEGTPPGERKARFVHLGRVSIAKGIDREVQFLNLLRSITTIDAIDYIGSIGDTPFKHDRADAFIKARLHPSLQAVVNFLGNVQPDAVLARCAGGGFGLNFSLTETFSYSFLEMLSAGLIPLTVGQSAMAEFYPEDLRGALLPFDFCLSTVSRSYDAAVSTRDYRDQILAHAKDMTDYERFSTTYAKAIDELKGRRIYAVAAGQSRVGRDVSILMATYNDRDTIKDAIASVKEQTVRPRELIIVDDGSTDQGALAIFEELKRDPLVRMIHAPANEGLCATRQKLISACTTDLAIFLDSDDELAPTYIEETLGAYSFSQGTAQAVCTLRKNFQDSSEEIIFFNFDDSNIFAQNNLRMTALIETQALRKLGFSGSMRHGEADDWDFWLRFKNLGYQLICVPELLFRYRFRNGSMSWPWSHGQVALTADLVSQRLKEAIDQNLVTPIAILDLMSNTFGAAANARSADLPRGTGRLKHVENLRVRRPRVASVLTASIRLTTGLAKRL